MSSEQHIEFEEKQYLGLNKYSIYRRALLIGFCLIVYFTSEHSSRIEVKDQTEQLLLIIASAIAVFSVVLLFILHLHTKVYSNSLEINGFWTARKVKIALSHIKQVEVMRYSRYLFNRPVYNLHSNGTVKFYTRGNYAVQLTDRDGLIYIIGTQRPEELKALIEQKLSR